MMYDDNLAQVEIDLLSDRAKVPGSIERWQALDEAAQSVGSSAWQRVKVTEPSLRQHFRTTTR